MAPKKRSGEPLDVRDSVEAPSEEASKPESSAAVLQIGMLLAFGAGIYVFREGNATGTAIAAFTAWTIAFVAIRFDRIRKLTSRLISFELEPAVRRADAATIRAKKAADVARATAERAADAASEAAAKTAELSKVVATMRTLVATGIGADLMRLAFDYDGNKPGVYVHLVNEMERMLREIGVSDEGVDRLTWSMRRKVLFYMCGSIVRAARDFAMGLPEGERRRAILGRMYDLAVETPEEVPSPKVLGEALKELDLMTEPNRGFDEAAEQFESFWNSRVHGTGVAPPKQFDPAEIGGE